MFLLYLWDSLVTLELISLKPLVGTPQTDPLAVKLLNNRLYISFFIVLDSNNSTSMFVQSESQSTFTPITQWNVGVGVKRRCETSVWNAKFWDAYQTSANNSTRLHYSKKINQSSYSSWVFQGEFWTIICWNQNKYCKNGQIKGKFCLTKNCLFHL